MAHFSCSVCGAKLVVNNRNQYVECEYCGNQNYIAVFDNDAIGQLKIEANREFRRGDFTQAMDRYLRLLIERPVDAEVHWFMALSRYGVEFVEDNRTGKRVVTCHRTLYDSILNDENYLNAIEYADIVTRKAYEKEALQIDNIQQRILSLSEEEEPFDVFLSYKEKDDDSGKRTRESETTEDLYYLLQREGLKVFYAPITLRDKAVGTEYEPYIFAALNSARLLYVIGYSEQHLNAVWVKNEWSRYLERMSSNRRLNAVLYFNSKTVARDRLPLELTQACHLFDVAEGTSLSDLLSLAIEQFGKRKSVSEHANSLQQVDTSLLQELAEKGQFDELNKKCDYWLDYYPEMGILHLYMLMAEWHISKIEDLGRRQKNELKNNRHFKRAMKYSNESELQIYTRLIND